MWLGRMYLEIFLKSFQGISLKILFSFSSPGGVTGWLKEQPVQNKPLFHVLHVLFSVLAPVAHKQIPSFP